MSAALLPLGLAEPVHGAQQSFRAALAALSRPGLPQVLGQPIAGLPLGAALAHLLLALADEDTLVWWQQPEPALVHWLRFHTGARATAEPGGAAFAVVTDAAALPPLHHFGAGSPAAPEGSTTLLVELPSLQGGPPVQAQGPGIRDRHTLALAGLPAGFWPQWQANQAAFPQGVDVIFTSANRLIGLPRTTRVAMAGAGHEEGTCT